MDALSDTNNTPAMSRSRLPPIPGPAADTDLSTVSSPPREKDLFGREPVGHPDWSHRRGEPRVFALIWMVYLMGVTIIMFASFMHALSISSSVTRPAAVRMVVATMLGIVLLWPAIRLAQQPSERPIRHMLRDLFVILVPAQAVVWPHAMGVLAGWPIELLLAISASFAAWGLVVGAAIACADSGAIRLPRWCWMLLVLLLVFASPLLGLAWQSPTGGAAEAPRVSWMLSPLTTLLELTRDRTASGVLDVVHPSHWRLLGAVACVGGAFVLLARAGEVAVRRRDP